jgi:diguanylate cyclase (GGDEF)-like protein
MPISILVVDDNPDNFDIIETLLDNQAYDIHYAPGGFQALEYISNSQPALILLDVMMPDIDGIEVCRRIKANPDWKGIPIIMITALTSKEDLSRCLYAGADDFIGKPVHAVELRARVHSMLRIHYQQQQIQQLNQSLEAQVEQRTARIQQLIDYDELTQLPNRRLLLEQIESLLAAPDPSTIYARCALIYLDCDQFQLINASLGHEVGNQVLQALAERLFSLAEGNDLLARIGEDEFCLLLPAVSTPDVVHQRIQRILNILEAPFIVNGYEVFVTASMGVAFGNQPHQNGSELLQDADTAVYKAKRQGRRGQVEIFDSGLHQLALARLKLENDLRRALLKDEFVVFYQPIYALHPQEIVAFEALVRWQHPERGMVSPGEFIPCIEQTGLIIPIGKLVLRKACEQLKQWQQLSSIPLVMSVNLSVRQFSHPYLLEDVAEILEETGVPPTQLKLEITESALAENPDDAIRLIQQLRNLQIQISIDDFGTGYSSLSYLNQFPVDTLKIDRSFINNIEQNPEIVRAIITLGHALNMNIVAEGIESKKQADYLHSLNCNFGQGYWLGRPADATQVEQLLSQNK